MFRSLFFFTALISLLQVSVARPTTVYNQDGSVEMSVEGRDLVKRKIRFLGWNSCGDGPGSQKQQVIDAWINMLDMAGKVKGNINFEERVCGPDTPSTKELANQPSGC